ncbi:MAG: HypC/HybG/HupF family hydrogenase formation chaperone [Planctomycetota bacterium]|nr:HypC/HybG/HupF family hydrogenase formation chaperone [Planctomycetota bacterium]
MCLSVPGEIVEVDRTDAGKPTARVRFGGITKEISLDFVPDAEVGEFVLVHVGFALQRIDEAEARATLAELERVAELGRSEDAPESS